MAIPLLLGSFYLARRMEISSELGVDYVAEGRGAEFGVWSAAKLSFGSAIEGFNMKFYIRQVNLDIEDFLGHYGNPGDRQFGYYQKA